jgi:RNA recognition motif-containing protein
MQDQDDSKLFVGGLPWALDSEDLREVFQEFGEIDQANVVYDRETGRSRGFGFVQFKDKDAATKALEAMNQAEIGGRTVNVNFAKARQDRPPRSFGGDRN